MMGWGNFGAGGHGVLMLLFWVLVIVAIAFLVRGSLSGPSEGGRTDRSGRNRALEILQERYANGEIDQEEYRRKRADLEK